MGRFAFSLLCAACTAAPLAAQSPLAAADSALASGQAWRATQILQPLLADPATRTSDAVMLAARAAAAWQGWPTVQRLLSRQPWLDQRFDGLGHRLLAEAALALGHDSTALSEARLAAAPEPDRDLADQAIRLVLLARAFDRLDAFDSAAATYRRAAALLPTVSDWLMLRAAGVTQDSAERATLYAGISLPAALPRVGRVEASARERQKDFTGAARQYDLLGDRAAALRSRWFAATTDSAKQDLGARAIALLDQPASVAESRGVLDAIALFRPALTDSQRLILARRAGAVSHWQGAADAYAAVAAHTALSERDQYGYAESLGALSRWEDAAAAYRKVTLPSLAGRAAYYQARALLRSGSTAAATRALRTVVSRYPRDSFAAGTALYLLGDLALDGGQPDSARSLFRRLAREYPANSYSGRALLVAALITLEAGNPRTAARELSEGLRRQPPGGLESDAYRYWQARATATAGDARTADSLFRRLLARGPDNYYAVLAAARLDTVPWTVTDASAPEAPGDVALVFGRIGRLDSLGLTTEARYELDQLATARNADSAFAMGEAFFDQGYPSRALRLGQRALAAGASRDAPLWRLIYPLPFPELLSATAAREKVDPLLAAALIRQESAFDAHATSRTDARGLMQVQPTTGRDLARGYGFLEFDPALLYVPDVNLAFGLHHFADALQRYPDLPRALAAYNAGVSRVDRWSQTLLSGPRSGARAALPDAEVFVERIPYVETRNYVRAITTNLSIYRMLYGSR